MRKLIQTLSLLLLLTYCSEDESEQKCRLVRQKYASIEYDDKGQVYAIQQLNDANEPVENGKRREFEYEDGKLVRIDERLGETLTRYFLFEYSPSQIIQREYFDEDSSVDFTVTYTLDSDEKIIQMILVDEQDRSLTRVYEYQGENVVKITTTSTEISGSIQEFEFDNKRNPTSIKGFEINFFDDIFSYRTQNANNITRSTLTTSGEAPSILNYTYTYNSQGYAVETFFNGGASPYWFYDFECK